MNFKEKVQSMTAKEIILAMVEGLRNPAVKVTMASFGAVKAGVCYGCAATNTICQIAGKTFTENNIEARNNRAAFLGVECDFLLSFEKAIGNLRQGEIKFYNMYAEYGDFAQIKIPNEHEVLPRLTNINYLEGLPHYERLAELQE